MHIKCIIISILFNLIFYQSVFAYASIQAENNAYRHNNKGLMYLQDKYYFGAIKEFQIAIDLMPKAQASAVYYVNLAKTYEQIGYNNLALDNYEKALMLHPLYFDYYLKTAQSYKNNNLLDSKLIEYKNKKFNPLNNIMIGLLYIQKGDIYSGISILDDFCNEEPDLIITIGVKNYIKSLINK